MLRLAIVEDKIFLSKAIQEKLLFFDDIQVKWTAENGKVCLENLHNNNLLDCILMDIEMPVMNGIEAVALVKQKHPHIKVIMLTVFEDDENIYRSIMAGADGYLLKDVSPDSLYKGISDTLNNGAAISPSIAYKALKLFRNPNFEVKKKSGNEISLTKREIEVLEQFSKGLDYIKVSKNLCVAPSTIRKHSENIYKKLRVHNKMQAVDMARRNNII